MRKILVVAVVAMMGLASVASAAPRAIYNPANGNVVFVNDTAAALPAAYLLSASAALGDAGNLLDIPGATKDPADFPMGYTYLNLPVGTFNTGNTVTAGTPIGDLTFGYYVGAITNPVNIGVVELAIPEPATLAMAGLGLVGVVAAARRKA